MYTLGYPEPSLQSIPVVREFSDVFEEVKSLPPRREIEFQIDLLPNAYPVVHASRRMAPREIIELVDQTRDLLQKGLIRSSVSE